MKYTALITLTSLILPLSLAKAADEFTVVSDTKKPLHGEVFKGTCEAIASKARENREKSITGSITNFFHELTGKAGCTEVGPFELTMGKTKKISAGQRVVVFKKVSGPEGLIPAYCFADPNKPGRILRLYTPKSESARGIFGRSFGFGLRCEQIEKMPK